MIEEIIKEQLYVESCISKRNQVNLVKGPDESLYILKKIQNPQARKNEIELLQLLHRNGVAVPCILETAGEYLLLEYLDGMLYLDKYEQLERDWITEQEIYTLIEDMLEWLAGFYKVTFAHYKTQIVLRDVNFRNFIVCKDGLYGIDFELCNQGDIVEELGNIAAFAFMYEPIGTLWKRRFVDRFIERSAQRFYVDRKEVEIAYSNALNVIKNRRNYKK